MSGTLHSHSAMPDQREAHLRERHRLTVRAAVASVSMALFLIGLKLWASIETGSVAMLGSLADTSLDIIASLVTLYSVRLAARPADADHRFGHGKAEALAALFQTGLIIASAVAIAWRGMSRLGGSEAPDNPELGIAVSLAAMAATLVLVIYQRSVVRRTGSVAIHADHVHYSSDLLLNASVIAAFVLDSILGLRGADPFFGVAISLWLVWHARQIAGSAIDQLMDREWPDEKRSRLVAVVSMHPDICGVHDVRTRTSGSYDFAQIGVWLDPSITVVEAHRILTGLRTRLIAEFPGTEVVLHADPASAPRTVAAADASSL